MRKGFLLLAATLLMWPGKTQVHAATKLDTTSFVVIGDGLAAGFANFSLQEVFQKSSFPAVMARQMGTVFPQPLIQAPGIGNAPGFPAQPVAVPAPGQTTVRTPFPPPLFIFNLAVPGHRIGDAISMRPTPPLIQPSDSKQTVTNMLLGWPSMILGPDKPRWTQLEYAVQMFPTLVLVELGYTEALEAAVQGNAGLMPDPAAFRAEYAKVLSTLKPTFAQLIATTIPDPMDTAYFNTPVVVSRLTGVPLATIVSKYGLKDGDLLTPNAVFSISVEDAALPAGSVIAGPAGAEITSRVHALNSEIAAAAKDAGALVYDLNAVFARVRASGLTVGDLTLTADYLGGYYTLSGYYPGTTGQAQIANEILALLNQTFKTNFQSVDLKTVATTDPAVRFRPYAVPGGTQ